MTPFWRDRKTSGRVKKHEKIEKVTCSQDDDFVGVSTKNKLSVMELHPGLHSAIAAGLRLEISSSHSASLALTGSGCARHG